jgi:hypothetical protein
MYFHLFFSRIHCPRLRTTPRTIRKGISPVENGRLSNLKKAQEKTPDVMVVVDDDDEFIPSSGSDMELVDESKIFEEAEAAYAKMITSVSKTPEKGQDNAEFDDDDYGEDKNIVPPKRRYIPTIDELLNANNGGGSITSKIAAKSSVKASSTDFGIRMGRSFRGGWSPNGTYITMDAAGRPIHRRPVFDETDGSEDDQSDLLNTLKGFSKPGSASRSPTFSLPRDANLGDALESFSTDTLHSSSLSRQAFSLLGCLFDSKEESSNQLALHRDDHGFNDISLEERRIAAISEWLCDSCMDSVDKEVSSAKVHQNPHAALLAAVSSGSIDKAVTLANELGYRQIACMLTAGPVSRKNILKEANSWDDKGISGKVADELRRVYFLAGGDTGMEDVVYKKKRSSYDWMRRMGMRLKYDGIESTTSLGKLIDDYEESITKGVVPYPQPKYLAGSSQTEVQCVLYRILQLGREQGRTLLSSIINPAGYTASSHDFGLAFHLSAVISATGMATNLSTLEESQLIDGYIAQLVTCGHWHWGVYVSLFKMQPSSSGKENAIAKEIILQLYRDDIASFVDRRNFLEAAGIPSEWFEEALAIRCLSQGQEYDYFSHMVHVSPDVVRSSIEKIWIPNMFVMDTDTLQKALDDIIKPFSPGENSLASAVCDFFELYQSIRYLEGGSKHDIEKALPSLYETCDNIEKVFVMYKSREAKLQGNSALQIIPSFKLVPLASFLAEGLAQVCLFRLQIRALENGLSIANASSQLLTLSMEQSREKFGIASENKWLRWLM